MSHILGISVFALALSSCSFFAKKPVEVESVVFSITDSAPEFFIGDQLLENIEYTVRVRYTDGSTKPLNDGEYSWMLTLNNTICDIEQPFSQLGNYLLRVKSIEDNLYSNAYSIVVKDMSIYTQSLDFYGPSTVGIGSKIKIEVRTSRYPKFNGYLAATPNNNKVNIYRTGDTTFELVGLESGFSEITFTANSSKNREISEKYDIFVNDSTIIEQDYHMLESRGDKYTTMPATGNVKMAVIPLWFTDSANYFGGTDKNGNEISTTQASINVRVDLEKAYFSESTDIDWESVASFYYKESFGKLNITGLVTSWYGTGHPSTDFYEGNEIRTEVIKNAVNWFFTMYPNENRMDYDSNHDGYLDAICFVYGCPSYNSLGLEQNGLWACKSALNDSSQMSVYHPGLNIFTWQSYDFMYNNNSCRNRTGKDYPCRKGIMEYSITPKTFIHEVGHLFGVHDLYDPNGNFNLTGGFNMQTDDRCGHDPYCVTAFGWANPIIPTESCTITINDFQNTHELILLTPEWNNYNSPFDEYLLLELYTTNGFNHFYSEERHEAPSMPGIRLWHIDSRLADYYDGLVYTSNVNNKIAILEFNNSSYENPDGTILKREHLVTLIRKDKTVGYDSTKELEDDDLFCEGDTFKMSEYSAQFLKGNKLNSNKSLGWEFKVLSIDYNWHNQTSVTIKLTKTA